MNEEKIFLENLSIMASHILDDYEYENDPLTRCELAKGYLEIGRYLIDNGCECKVKIRNQLI